MNITSHLRTALFLALGVPLAAIPLAGCEDEVEDSDDRNSDAPGFPGYTTGNPLNGYVRQEGLCLTLGDVPKYGNIVTESDVTKCYPILSKERVGPATATTDYVEVWTYNPAHVGVTDDSRNEYISVQGRGRLCKALPVAIGRGQLPLSEQRTFRWGAWRQNPNSSNPNVGTCRMWNFKTGQSDHTGLLYGHILNFSHMTFFRQKPTTPYSEQYVFPGAGDSSVAARSKLLGWKLNAGPGLFRRLFVRPAAGSVKFKEFLPNTITSPHRSFCKVVDPLAPDYEAIGLQDSTGGCETPPAVKPGHETTVSTTWEPLYLPLAFTALEEVTKTNYTARAKTIVSSSNKYYPWYSRSLGTATVAANNLKGAVCMFEAGGNVRVGVTDKSKGCVYSSTSSAATFVLPLFHRNRMPASVSEAEAGTTSFMSERIANEQNEYHRIAIDGHVELYGSKKQLGGADNINAFDINIAGDVRTTLDAVAGTPIGVPAGGFVFDNKTFEDEVTGYVERLRTSSPSGAIFASGDSDEVIAAKIVLYLLEEIPKDTSFAVVTTPADRVSSLDRAATHIMASLFPPMPTPTPTPTPPVAAKMSNNLKLRALAGITVRRNPPGGSLYADTRTVSVVKDSNYQKWRGRLTSHTHTTDGAVYPFYVVPGKIALMATVLGYLDTYYGESVANSFYLKNVVNSRKIDNAVSTVFYALLRRGFAYGYVKDGAIRGSLMLDAASNIVNEVAALEVPTPGATVSQIWSSCPLDESLKISQCFENASLDDLASYIWVREDFEDEKVYTQVMAARNPAYTSSSFEFLSSGERTDSTARFLSFATDWYNFYEEVSFGFATTRAFTNLVRRGGGGTFGRYVRPSKLKIRSGRICRAL